MDRRKADVVIGSILIAISLFILTNDNLVVGGVETDLGSMFLPRLLAFCIMAFSANIAISALLKLRRAADIEQHEIVDLNGYGGIAVYVTIFALYWYLVPILGFIATTPFAMIAISTLLGGRNWKIIVPLSVIAPVLIYYGCYNYLRVMLPVWSLT
ncbi:MAG: tripartite tricarboxylate transporter TctB family protein [Desulfovibrionales bacterium]|nr:tripartite tricarboxylate transporter TctB family protein [Desulfovibrionales bacterium]